MDKNIFLEYYHKGFSDSKIAKILNMDRHAVSETRKSLSLPRMSKVEQYKHIIIKLVNEGKSDIAISRQLNISKSMIGYIRKRLKIKTNFVERIYKTKNERIKGYMIRCSRGNAKRRGLKFTINYTDIQLPKNCPIIGCELNYHTTKNEFNQASLDRIDNTKGYIKGNVMVISRLANAMKNEANFDQLKSFSVNILKIIDWYRHQKSILNINDIFPNLSIHL